MRLYESLGDTDSYSYHSVVVTKSGVTLRQEGRSLVPYHQGKQLPVGTLTSIIEGSGILAEEFR